MNNKIKVISAHSPVWATPEKVSITLQVKFSHFPGEVPFTATPTDTMDHAKEVLGRALAGEYGEVAEYKGPSQEDVQQYVLARGHARSKAEVESRIQILERAKRLGMTTDAELMELEELERSSVELMRL
ncbi:hypothetical protein [Aeromonas sp. Y318-3]|uniref:hypothetical protein n=1 Tax=Aeromonas sp. Y318-3 TaxID=2990509 RepID=UPI0022DF278A|nr:hypothetical protein [Aeromonas sp. Y318-3]